MAYFKISSLCLILTAWTASYVMGTEEVLIDRSPATSYFKNIITPHRSPIKLSPVKSQRNYRTLEIDRPLQEHELGQLMDTDCREIYLVGVYIAYEENGSFFKKAPFIISPETINPDVEVLSLKCCGITDSDIKGIGEFKKLKKLILVSNHLTDACSTSISSLEQLESLSLALNDISNVSVPLLLAMPNLTDLNISHNKKIDDSVAGYLFESTNLEKLNVHFTGLTRSEQRRLEKKYKNFGQ